MTFLNVVEIESAIMGLATQYPTAAQLITLPFLTAEGRRSHALRLGIGSCHRTSVLLISGTHAREWGGPDIVVNLAADLLEAWSSASGLVYGGTTFTAGDIERILERVELILFPDINPDGRHYSQTVDSIWRKNRNPASSGGVASRIGVDLNRNYDFLWDYSKHFSSNAASILASNDPSTPVFHGTAAFSEAETRNVRWLFDQYPDIHRFVDIHSYGGNILHPWGDDANQSTNSSMNFRNGSWDGQRGVNGDAYQEYIGTGDLVALQGAGNSMKAALAGVRGQSYNVAQSFFMPGWPTTYPTSGASHDWAFSRHFSPASKPRVLGMLLEFNKDWGQFFPTWTEMEKIILDVDAGLVRFTLDASPPRRWWWILDLCWWREWVDGIWRRLFPWEIWGPFGPWSRIRILVVAVINPIVTPVVAVIRRVLGRPSR